MKNYSLRPRAERDLENIWRYSASRWDVAQADAYLSMIESAMGALAQGRIASPSDIVAGYGRRLAGSHVIYYQAGPDGIVVVRILHQSMDVGRHLK